MIIYGKVYTSFIREIVLLKNNFIEGNYGMVCREYSDNNTIINNTFSGCFWMNYGSELCKNNKIVNNTFYKPVADGIYIQYCYYHSILNNTFIDNGIFIFKAYNNRIEDNIVNGKQLMYLENEEDTILTGNYGQILLVNCSNISSEQPQDLSHTVVGIELINTKNSTISNCTIYDNNWEGIYGNNASGNTLFNITTSSNWDEILFRYCNNNNISDSRLFQSAENLIIFDTCHNNILYNNIFGASNSDGVRLITSNNNTFIYNEFYGFDLLAALLISESASNVITYNTIRNSARAIMISCSDGNKIFYNQIIDNMFGVLCLSSHDFTSDNNTIKFNNIINSQCGFEYFSLKQLKFSNRWSRNYWGEIRILPKPILGFFYGPIGVLTIPLYQFDWNPKKIPNKILDSEEKYLHIK